MTSSTLLRVFVATLTLAWAALAGTPTLVTSRSQLTIDAVANGPAPLSQTFTVAASDSSFINIETLVDAGSAGTPAPAWITVTPHLATTPAQVEVAGNAAGLAAGDYKARIQFTDTKGVSFGTPVTVTLRVASARAKLSVNPPILNIAGPIAQGYLQQGLFLRSEGPGTLAPVSVNVVSGYPWLSVVVPSCETSCAITVKSAVASLSAGPHTGLLHVSTALGSADVPVSLFAAGDGPFLQVAPGGLQFNTVTNTHLADSRSLTLLNQGNGPANWAADIMQGQAWLSLSTNSGVTAAGGASQLTVTMNSGSMAANEYGGFIRISASDGTFNPLYVPVILRVELPDAPPVPLLSTGGLFFQANVGDEGVQAPLTLSAGSVGSVEFQVSAQSSGWLSAGPMRGELSGTSPAPLSIVETPIALQTGYYSGLVNIAFGTGALRSLNAGISVVNPAVMCTPQFLYLTEIGTPNNFATRVGFATPLEAVLVDDCGNLISNALVNAAFSNGDSDLTLEPLGNGHYAGTWIPAHASDSLSNGVATVALRGFAPPLAAAITEVIGTVAIDSLPSVNADSVLNNLNPQVGFPVAPGTIVQIYGSALGPTGAGAISNGQLPTTLNGVSVIIGGFPAPLFYGSNGQINAQLPNELAPGQQYELLASVNGFFSNPVTVNTTELQPGIASFADGGVIAQDTSYQLITADHPAHSGEAIILYATGMGATNPAVATGSVTPQSPLSNAVVQPQVTIGKANARVLFAGLSPGSVGLYQIDVVIPSGVTGNSPLVVTQNGVASNTVTVPIE